MAHNENGEIHIDEEAVSGGSKEGVVRWILGIGLVLAIIVLSLVWIVPAMTQGDAEGDISSRSGEPAEMAEMEGDDTDGIIEPDDLPGGGNTDAATMADPEPSADAEVETTEN